MIKDMLSIAFLTDEERLGDWLLAFAESLKRFMCRRVTVEAYVSDSKSLKKREKCVYNVF